jgi:eukaryotic-like serine/threonine-protein kinase
MDADRRRRISLLYHEARTRADEDRAAFLAAACGDDEALCREVEALLSVDTGAGAGPARPVAEGLDVTLAADGAAGNVPAALSLLPSGSRFARYRIVGRLGAGGMGEVYHGRDEQLDRDVAIKVLPASSFDDPAARLRLVREARAAAALNHPNICTVYEVGETGGQAYIAMEMVEGQTLSSLLPRGGLPVDQVVHYGRQLAAALAHAHARGVIHRDLKCQNVMVTPDGRVKVLDFGLARRAIDAGVVAVTEIHVSLTQPGTAVGTLPYMSPEQLRGEKAQVSSDLWALGVVLYELTTGRLPFKGQTPFELSAAILNDAPAALPAGVPRFLEAAIARCLVKDPRERFQRAADVGAALEARESDAPAAAPPPPAPPVVTLTLTRRRAMWLGGVALMAAAAGLAGWQLFGGGAVVRSLAVLPLANPAGDEDLEYLCDGITESLIRQISRLRSVRVNHLNTVLAFKAQDLDLPVAGRRLGVGTVLAGTLERDGTRLRITTQLVDVATGRQLWAGRYDRDEHQLLEVQDEIASALMDEGLRVSLSADDRQQLVRHPTNDGEAYDLYLQARHLQRRATEEDYLYSRELLQRATTRDPNFAMAYAALAGNYAMMVVDGLERPTAAWPQANRYMRQAIALDPESLEGFGMAHASAFYFDWDWKAAELVRRRMLQSPLVEFDPQYLRSFALELWALGRSQEALELARRTRELDPLSTYLSVLEADYLLRDGQLDAAAALYERAARVDPENPNSFFGLAEARYRQGRFDEALAARRTAHAIAGDERLEPLFETARGAPGYGQIDRAWVHLQLEVLEERQMVAYVSPLDFARAYAQLGERDRAFEYLDAAFADRAPGLVFLNVDPAWDLVRDDPRLADAVRRVGLP